MIKNPYIKPENHNPQDYLKHHKKMEMKSFFIEFGIVSGLLTIGLIIVLAVLCTCCDPGSL